LLRIAFVRKNKTLRASFLGTSAVIDLLEANYRLYCAQHDIALPNDDAPTSATAAEPMDVEMEQDDEEFKGFSDPDLDDDEVPDFFAKATAASTKQTKGSGRKRRGRVTELVKEKIRRVLEEETQLADKRARMCDEGDFLKLLWAFNEEGIHFA